MKQVETVYPILWTIPRVESAEAKVGYYRTLKECSTDCHSPIHAFHNERMRHLIPSHLVDKAMERNWWDDVVDG